MADGQGAAAARNIQLISSIDKHGKMSRIAAEMNKLQGQMIHRNKHNTMQQLGDRQLWRRTVTAQSSEEQSHQAQKISSFGERYKMYLGEIKNSIYPEQQPQSSHKHPRGADTPAAAVVVVTATTACSSTFKLPELKYQLKKTLPMLVAQESSPCEKIKSQNYSASNSKLSNQIQQLSSRREATETAPFTHSVSQLCQEIATPIRKGSNNPSGLSSSQLPFSNHLNNYFLHDPKRPFNHHHHQQQHQSTSTSVGFDASASFSVSNAIESSSSSQLIEDITIKSISTETLKILKKHSQSREQLSLVREHKRYGSLLRQRTTTSQNFLQDSLVNLTQLSASCKNIDSVPPVKQQQFHKQPSSCLPARNNLNANVKQSSSNNYQLPQQQPSQKQRHNTGRISSLSPNKQSQSTLATCSEEGEIHEKIDSNTALASQNTLPSSTSNLAHCPSVQQLQQHILKQPIRPKAFLNEEDRKIYGDRFIQGYTKVSLLGKGGFAAVWQAIEDSTGKYVAVKQISAAKGSDSGVREIKANKTLFDGSSTDDNTINENDDSSCGFLRVLQYIQTPYDLFLVSELGRGQSLSKQVYTLKGEFYQGERIYSVEFSPLHAALFKTKSNTILKDLLRQLLQQLCLLNSKGLVHGDIKPENILVSINDDNALHKVVVESVTLIDFGSAYSIHDKSSIPTATPNYLPPEVIEILIEGSKGVKSIANSCATASMSSIERLKSIGHGYAVDVWCLGAAFVEILSGIPHWLHYKCRVPNQSNPHHSSIRYGLFSTRNQDYQKIFKKQHEFCENFFGNIVEIVNNFDCFETAKQFAELLQRMMQFNPKERLSPEDALNHRFFDSK